MKITTKREFYAESERRVTIRFPADRIAHPPRFCADCRTDSLCVTADAAAAVRQTTVRQIFRFVEARQIHFLETESGVLLVCLASLAPEQTANKIQ